MEGNRKLQHGCPYFVKNINLERPVQRKCYKNCLEQTPWARQQFLHFLFGFQNQVLCEHYDT